jgi:hypothetical protein
MLDRSFNHWFLDPLYGKGFLTVALFETYQKLSPSFQPDSYGTKRIASRRDHR